MDNRSLRRPLWALGMAILLGISGLAAAEPPSRAARLAFIDGTVSFSPAGQPDWVRATVNRPLTTGDRLWSGGSSRAELQIGGTAIRMGPSTSTVLLNLDDRIAQVQLSQGSLKIRVRSLGPRQTLEVATPNLAVTQRRRGEFRIEVDPDDEATVVTVESGEVEVYGEGASYTVDSRRAYRFYGTDLSDYEIVSSRRDDELDRWSRERDRRGEHSVSARYVSSEVVGYEDLDANGAWSVDATYGNVWTPRRVDADWTPYRDGHWAWVDPWGWTWVDDAPWGYAVSHYGRWAHIRGSWAWVPGPRRERAVYAPALVAFVGGKNFQVSVSVGGAAAVGWFPLAPREVYRPSYPVSRGYFDNINRSNAVLAPTAITQIYNTTIVNTTTTHVTNIVYANQQVKGALVAVPTQAFVQSRPVARATVRLSPEVVRSAPILRVASVAPVQQSLQGGADVAATRPPVREHAIVARTAPPPAPLPFADRQAQPAARPGTPTDKEQRTQLKAPAQAVVAREIKVVAKVAAPTPTALPPATPPAGKSPQARKAAAAKAGEESATDRKPQLDPTAAAAAAAAAQAAKAETATAEDARAAGAKAREGKADKAKTEKAKADSAKADASEAAAANAEAVRAAAARLAAAKADTAKAEAARAEAGQAAAAKAAARSAEAAKQATDRAAEARADVARAADEKARVGQAAQARAEQAKAAEARAEKAKSDAARAESSQVEAARVDAARAAQAGAERAERAGAAKAERADAAKAERAGAAKAAADKANSAQAEAAKAEATRSDAAKAARRSAEAAKGETARADAAKDKAAQAAGQAKAEAAKADAAQADLARAQAAKAEADKAERAVRADRADKAEKADKVERRPKAPAAAAAPQPQASAPKSDAEQSPEDEKKGRPGRGR